MAMAGLVYILTHILLPVFLIIGCGVGLQRRFHFDLSTLAKINIHFFVPAIMFSKLYAAPLSLPLLFWVTVFFILFILTLYGLSAGIGRLLGLHSERRLSFTHSVLFYNSGNYGIPVNHMVFKQDPYAMSIQIFISAFQNILVYLFGAFQLQAKNQSHRGRLLVFGLRMPSLYALGLAVALNGLGIGIPSWLKDAVDMVANGYIAVALLTLGAQIAPMHFRLQDVDVFLSVFFRLMIAPAIACGLIVLLQLDGVLARALLISSAMPTSVSHALIAQEYEHQPALAARVVLFSTVTSAITLTLVIYLSDVIF